MFSGCLLKALLSFDIFFRTSLNYSLEIKIIYFLFFNIYLFYINISFKGKSFFGIIISPFAVFSLRLNSLRFSSQKRRVLGNCQ